ncbi:Quinone oxidoreductase 1 [Pseudovibrio axinellae]|uniref:Quinone oxidoreductase 1 n=1 Tax=Pseudovibrio axinellae TaxID=989403 RepID=A0A165ZGQ4_9HYPH|nr:quinone oxidoreductase [Pseudovibrio axinellae]KZL19881.1 Quinone oxidoreductase 1 [Pseudovibrio axinellae]SER38339.1 NADPH2:quinone reductase [Pseudovibrio axinellae]
MSLSIELQTVGGPEVFATVNTVVPDPTPEEVQVRQTTIGVNYVDIYHRKGLYPLPQFAAVLGVEGAGVVVAVGTNVANFHVGQRVAYAATPPGSYAETRNIPQGCLIGVPDDLSNRLVGSSMLRGLTAQMILRRVHSVSAKEFVLVHAGAGGLGQLVSRWATQLGAIVIATVGSERKIAIAKNAGAKAVFLHSDPNWAKKVIEFTGGQGVHLACDGIGGNMLKQTIACIRPFGTLANLGQPAGAVPPLHVEEIGSIKLSQPSVIAYIKNIADYRLAATDLFSALRSGLINAIGAEYALTDAALAHTELEAGRTTGSTILLPT